MTAIIVDPELEKAVIRRRQETGADRWDEAWEGLYVINPLPNTEHQDIVANIGAFLVQLFRLPGKGIVFGGINYAANPDDWQHDYRCARHRGVPERQHGSGTARLRFTPVRPIFSPKLSARTIRVREKLPFYEKLRVHELLINRPRSVAIGIVPPLRGQTRLRSGCHCGKRRSTHQPAARRHIPTPPRRKTPRHPPSSIQKTNQHWVV